MAHQVRDIDGHHAGDFLRINVTVYDSNGDLKDLTNGSGEWLLKETEEDPDSEALVSKDSEGGGVELTDPENGELEINIDTGDTEGLVGQKHHRCRVTDEEGRRSTVFHGTFEISL